MPVAELNSVHLDASRLASYRQARDRLLTSCGSQTLQISGESLHEQIAKICKIGSASSIKRAKKEPLTAPFVTINRRQRMPLKVGHNTIGRLPDNDIVANDGFMSRRHCAILVHSDLHAELHDLASKNGTFLNGVKINSPTRLSPGDEIQLGELRICYMGEPPAKDAGTPDRTCVLADSGEK